uniref:Uncharacterized protein n=1 Tax=viral metagenome TaxID=1070528 RepID=A0A6C0I3G7_9ZZZZ
METIMREPYQIGEYGPHLLVAMNTYKLLETRSSLFAFLGGFIINILFNQVLKQWIKQERPIPIKDSYGMPSLHAQSVSFATVYLYCVTGSNFYLLLEGAFSLITLYQRWKTRKHTPEQLAVGSVIGSIMGYGIYKSTQTYNII